MLRCGPAGVRGAADVINYAYSLRHGDIKQAVAAARRGVELIEASSIRTVLDRDLRARAWGVLGNSLRIAGSLSDAGRSLDVADYHRRSGSNAPPLQIEGARFRASLEVARRHFDEAEALLLRAQAVASDCGESREVVRCQIKLAVVASYLGDFRRSVELIEEALPWPGWEGPELKQIALQVALSSLVHDDRLRDALELSLLSEPLFAGCGEMVELKVRWVRALIAAKLGRPARLREIQVEYAARNMTREVALVGLDLAMAYLQYGETKDARVELLQVLPALRLYGFAPEIETMMGEVAALKRLRCHLGAAAQVVSPADRATACRPDRRRNPDRREE